MSGGTPAIKFSKPWLKFIKKCKEDINLSVYFDRRKEETHLLDEKGAATTFYGNSAQSTVFLKYTALEHNRDISDSLRLMDN